jgi:hypothetical protein
VPAPGGQSAASFSRASFVSGAHVALAAMHAAWSIPYNGSPHCMHTSFSGIVPSLSFSATLDFRTLLLESP